MVNCPDCERKNKIIDKLSCEVREFRERYGSISEEESKLLTKEINIKRQIDMLKSERSYLEKQIKKEKHKVACMDGEINQVGQKIRYLNNILKSVKKEII